MRLLLDTHVFLWYIGSDPRLTAAYRAAIQDSANEVFLSAASIWEAVIKHQLGKLPLPSPPAEYLPRQREAHGIAALPIDERVMLTLAELPPNHRDPFDRMLVAQAIQHGFTLLSTDPDVITYPVAVLPAS
jgi:PIN domain nuclease of toxin-antitoxin system